MSGGAFNYAQYQITEIIIGIRDRIVENDFLDYKYSKKTIEEFKTAIRLLKEAQIYAHRIDWLISGDDSEETFHNRLRDNLCVLNLSDD